MQQYIDAYRHSRNTTTNNKTQILMLYDGAISSLMQAAEAIEKNNLTELYNKVEKAYLIISSLRDSLDFESGGEVAECLKDWYNGVVMRIIAINRRKDVKLAELCIKNLKTMRDSWKEAIESEASSQQEYKPANQEKLNTALSYNSREEVEQDEKVESLNNHLTSTSDTAASDYNDDNFTDSSYNYPSTKSAFAMGSINFSA